MNENKNPTWLFTIEDETVSVTCSECGAEAIRSFNGTEQTVHLTKYCPSCGAMVSTNEMNPVINTKDAEKPARLGDIIMIKSGDGEVAPWNYCIMVVDEVHDGFIQAGMAIPNEDGAACFIRVDNDDFVVVGHTDVWRQLWWQKS